MWSLEAYKEWLKGTGEKYPESKIPAMALRWIEGYEGSEILNGHAGYSDEFDCISLNIEGDGWKKWVEFDMEDGVSELNVD